MALDVNTNKAVSNGDMLELKNCSYFSIFFKFKMFFGEDFAVRPKLLDRSTHLFLISPSNAAQIKQKKYDELM